MIEDQPSNAAAREALPTDQDASVRSEPATSSAPAAAKTPVAAKTPANAAAGPKPVQAAAPAAGATTPGGHKPPAVKPVAPNPAVVKPAAPPAEIKAKVPASRLEGMVTEAPPAWTADIVNLDAGVLIRHQRNRFLFRLMMFVGLPVMFAAAYVYLYAAPRYVTEFQISYQSSNPASASSGAASGLAGLLGVSGGTVDMAQVVMSHLTSQAMADTLDKKIDLRKRLSYSKIDWWNRMPANASEETFVSYYLNRVSVYESSGGFLVVDVSAFTPQDAKVIGEAMIKASDEMVSDMTDRLRRDTVQYSEGEVNRFDKQLRQATLDITNFRNNYYDYDFQGTVSQLGVVVSGLRGQLAQAKADLDQSKSLLSDTAPSVLVQNSKIAAIKAQIEIEENRLGSPNAVPVAPQANSDAPAKMPPRGSEPYSKIMATYADLLQDQQFATASYVGAKQVYEAALLDAVSKHDYVVSFVPPSVPQDSISPSGWRSLLLTFIGSLMAYAIGSLLVDMFRDQAGI